MIRDPELWKQQQYRAIELNGAQEPNSLKSFDPKSTSLLLAEARQEPSLLIPCSSFYALVIIIFFFFFLLHLLLFSCFFLKASYHPYLINPQDNPSPWTGKGYKGCL